MSMIQVRHEDAVVELPEGATVREALGRLGVMRNDVIAATVARSDAGDGALVQLPGQQNVHPHPHEEWDLDRALPSG
ncbi:MAG: hypothetical protein O2980_02295, partial [Actinomycetota bacterium]|nr:hypothetical protein [Actinomycetota bacterium]